MFSTISVQARQADTHAAMPESQKFEAFDFGGLHRGVPEWSRARYLCDCVGHWQAAPFKHRNCWLPTTNAMFSDSCSQTTSSVPFIFSEPALWFLIFLPRLSFRLFRLSLGRWCLAQVLLVSASQAATFMMIVPLQGMSFHSVRGFMVASSFFCCFFSEFVLGSTFCKATRPMNFDWHCLAQCLHPLTF